METSPHIRWNVTSVGLRPKHVIALTWSRNISERLSRTHLIHKITMARDPLPYHRPDIAIILIQAGFLLALNLVNIALDKIIYCGQTGQLLNGIAWEVPGGNFLVLNFQEPIQQLGYLGLLLLVYEGTCCPRPVV